MQAPVPTLCALPSEILEQQIIRSLDARALCALGAASRATRQVRYSLLSPRALFFFPGVFSLRLPGLPDNFPFT